MSAEQAILEPNLILAVLLLKNVILYIILYIIFIETRVSLTQEKIMSGAFR